MDRAAPVVVVTGASRGPGVVSPLGWEVTAVPFMSLAVQRRLVTPRCRERFTKPRLP